VGRFRLGVDIGGTFTDATLIDEATGELHIAKVLTTPSDPSIGFMTAVSRIIDRNAIEPHELGFLVHATTVATNSIIEGKVAKAGLLATDGFRDVLEIARQMRPSMYDVQFTKPRPLVERHLSVGIPERLDPSGQVLIPLDSEAVRQAAEHFRNEEVESIAVCFLHSYVNADHERIAGEILADAYPEAIVSLSADVAPEIREYLRTSTTVINASVRPVVAQYLERIEERLREAGITCQLLVMQSSGGVYSAGAAKQSPVSMVESGPAAGVIAASYLGDTVGLENMLSFDMGGTTAKAGLIVGGTPKVSNEYEVGATAMAAVGSHRGSGYPILTPVIDLVEIGAGGGSIAWVDSGGALRVGPHSAGADPGPCCYGQGGEEPTVTDANLVLGRLNPTYFLGGEIDLDVDAAREAVLERCAKPLGLGLFEAAIGIVEIANTAMVNALRLVSIQRGYDPREFALVAFGGAGPMHANRLAVEMGVTTVVVPVRPGVFSSVGLLVTDVKRDYSAALGTPITGEAFAELDELVGALEERGRTDLSSEGLEESDLSFVRSIDMRYVGQSYELTIPLPAARMTEMGDAAISQLLEGFHAEHDRAYGFSAPTEAVEAVAVRVTALGHVEKPQLRELPPSETAGQALPKERRQVAFAEAGGYVDVDVFDRYELAAGSAVTGPALVEEVESSTVIHPGYVARVDRFGNLIVTPAASEAQSTMVEMIGKPVES
jgi:N-methylhydantoinase A